MNNSTLNFTFPFSFEPFQILEICLHSISFLTGVPTHCYIIWLIVTGTGNGIVLEFFILNFSFSEIANCLTNLLTVLNYWIPDISGLKDFLTGSTIAGRPLFQCLICAERYLAVVHPVTFLKYKPLRYRLICSSLAWVLTLGSCLISMFTRSSKTLPYMWWIVLQFIVLLTVQLFFLLAILKALKQTGPGNRKKEEENHMKRRAFYLILISTLNMLITYVPLCFTGFYCIFSQLFLQSLWLPSVFFFVITGFVQPVLYLYRTEKLPLCCKKVLTSCP